MFFIYLYFSQLKHMYIHIYTYTYVKVQQKKKCLHLYLQQPTAQKKLNSVGFSSIGNDGHVDFSWFLKASAETCKVHHFINYY